MSLRLYYVESVEKDTDGLPVASACVVATSAESAVKAMHKDPAWAWDEHEITAPKCLCYSLPTVPLALGVRRGVHPMTLEPAT